MSSAEQGSDIGWRRASFCGGGECVEVGAQDDMIVVRDSKEPSGFTLRYSKTEWQAFIAGVKAGEFDSFGCNTSSTG
jgi:predicted secreted Zn-dependent protease